MATTTDDGVGALLSMYATRHGLDDVAMSTLESHIRLLDWEAGNFLPSTAPELPEMNSHVSAAHLDRASRMMGEVLSALDLASLRTAGRLADIGTGAGFPGLVLAIALPATEVVLVESDPSKSGFLRNLAEFLDLENVQVVGSSLQSLIEEIGTFDVVTSRRVWRMHTILEHIAPLVAPRGATIRFQPAKPDKEELVLVAAKANGFSLEAVLPAMIETPTGPARLGKRNIYVYRKVGSGTPEPNG